MKTRLTRHTGSLFAFLILAGCAVPPNAPDHVSNVTTTTQPDAGRAVAPQAFDAGAAKQSTTDSKLADADALGESAGPSVADFRQTGRASWYGGWFHGRKTANGERFNKFAMTAAHRTLPLGSYVRVTNPATNESVIVRINDRGPYARGRIIDLSYAAAKVLHLQHVGTGRVQIEGLTQQQAKAEQAEILASNGNPSVDK